MQDMLGLFDDLEDALDSRKEESSLRIRISESIICNSIIILVGFNVGKPTDRQVIETNKKRHGQKINTYILSFLEPLSF